MLYPQNHIQYQVHPGCLRPPQHQCAKDRQEFMQFFAEQQQANQDTINQIKATLEEIRLKNITLAKGFDSQSQEISQQLEQAAKILETRIGSLEKAAHKISEFKDIQESFDNSLLSLDTTKQLKSVLDEVNNNLKLLNPVLNKLNLITQADIINDLRSKVELGYDRYFKQKDSIVKEFNTKTNKIQ